MKNETLKKFAISMSKKNLQKTIKNIKENCKNHEEKTINEILESWWFKKNFTKREIKKIKNNANCSILSCVKMYEKKLIEKATKAHNNFVSNIDNIVNSELPEEIKICVEYKKNRTWGANPTAEIWADNYIKSRSIGGCGYDKESTATAECFNKSNAMKKILLICAYKDNKKKNKTYGYYFNTYYFGFEGGVGFSCHEKIIEIAGYKMTGIYGNMFNSYIFTKVGKNV